jgi:thiol-disulfide isomerase/thioredoxin
MISAEEVSAEAVRALARSDAHALQALLLTEDERQALGLGKTLDTQLRDRLQAARDQLKKAAPQSSLGETAGWVDFGALRPGLLPAGTDGASNDVIVYENVVAIVEDGGQHGQVTLGTLVKVANGWRLIDLPVTGDESSAAQRFAFFTLPTGRTPPAEAMPEGVGPETQKLVTLLEELDQQLASAAEPRQLAELNARRADTLQKLAAAAASEKDRDLWLMQLADTVGAAVQSGAYPEGTSRLEQTYEQLENSSRNKELLSHLKFVHMTSDYASSLQSPKADFAQVQEKWLEDLEAFVKEFPQTDDTPEAMLQLALAREFSGEEEEARRWYAAIAQDFPSSQLAGKAAGAKRRLESVGQRMPLAGTTGDGKRFDLARLRGNVVLIHYWATWCEPCKQDLETLRRIQQQFAGKRLTLVGVNLDTNQKDAADFLRKHRLPWIQLHEPGGLDGRLATEMGIFTLPVMILVDQQGRVVNRQVHISELESELQKRL